MINCFFIFFNKRHFLLLGLLLFCSIDLSAIEFIYPIAQLPDGTSMVMHQNSPYDILLATYDFKNNKVSRSFLSSQFCPTKVFLLPDKTGFSFFDNGIIKIQTFLKRSPKTIEIIKPVSHLQDIEWESPHIFYVNALYKKQNALFRVNLSVHDATIDFIIFSLNSDFLCPQKRGRELFFIDRSSDKSKIEYHFSGVNFESSFDTGKKKLKNKKKEDFLKADSCQKEYSPELGLESYNVGLENHTDTNFCNLNNIQILVNFKDQPIIFLTMDTETEGAAIGYDSNTKKTDNTILFFYYSLYKNEEVGWQKKLLFSFFLPTDLFLGDHKNRLIESIFPLLPKKIGNTTIYYSSLVGQNVNLFSFSLENSMSRQLTFTSQTDQHYFCPIMLDGKLYCGQSLIDKNQKIDLYCVSKS